jgi:hypothetical protein
MSARLEGLVGNAILGTDTLWGGDVMSASGTGRFIADSWFGDEPLPMAYTAAEAGPVRQSGGVAAKSPDLAAIDAYLAKVDIPGAIEGLKGAAGCRAAGSPMQNPRRVALSNPCGAGHGDIWGCR